MTLDEAKALIERMRLTRPTCPKCPRVGYDLAVSPEAMMQLEFEEAATFAGWIKRCRVCADSFAYPWADQLDPQKVIEFDAARQHAFVWLLDDLKETL